MTTATKIIAFIFRLEARNQTSSIFDAIKDSPASTTTAETWAELADLSIEASTYIPGEPLSAQPGRIGELRFCRSAMDTLRSNPAVRQEVGRHLLARALEIEKEKEEAA